MNSIEKTLDRAFKPFFTSLKESHFIKSRASDLIVKYKPIVTVNNSILGNNAFKIDTSSLDKYIEWKVYQTFLVGIPLLFLTLVTEITLEYFGYDNHIGRGIFVAMILGIFARVYHYCTLQDCITETIANS